MNSACAVLAQKALGYRQHLEGEGAHLSGEAVESPRPPGAGSQALGRSPRRPAPGWCTLVPLPPPPCPAFPCVPCLSAPEDGMFSLGGPLIGSRGLS